MNFRVLVFGASFVSTVAFARAVTPPLLHEAVEKWETGAEEWAFTQRVRTYDNDKVKLERLERYDPSRPDNRRWELLEIDGKPPTAEQREYWQDRKNRKAHKRSEKSLEDYFDFEHATVAGETKQTATFEVPLRKETTRLVELDKFEIQLTVNKSTKVIEHITAGLREPLKVALGLARITDVDLDVRFDPLVRDLDATKSPQPSGEVHVVMFKLGDRAEYAWTDFKRVTPYATRNRS